MNLINAPPQIFHHRVNRIEKFEDLKNVIPIFFCRVRSKKIVGTFNFNVSSF